MSFLLAELKDPATRLNFERLRDIIRLDHQLEGFRHMEITIPQAGSDLQVPHQLEITPKDVLVTSVTNGATVTWQYDDFDDEFLVLTASGPCVIRAFVGTYREESLNA